MVTIKKNKLKKLLYGFDGITKEEWNCIKPYIEHKFEVNGVIKNPLLMFKTLKYFFIKVKN